MYKCQRLNYAQPLLVYRDSTNCTLFHMLKGHGALRLDADDVCPVADCVATLVVALELDEPVACDCTVTDARLELEAAAVVASVLWLDEVLLLWLEEVLWLWAVVFVDDTINVGVAA